MSRRAVCCEISGAHIKAVFSAENVCEWKARLINIGHSEAAGAAVVGPLYDWQLVPSHSSDCHHLAMFVCRRRGTSTVRDRSASARLICAVKHISTPNRKRVVRKGRNECGCITKSKGGEEKRRKSGRRDFPTASLFYWSWLLMFCYEGSLLCFTAGLEARSMYVLPFVSSLIKKLLACLTQLPICPIFCIPLYFTISSVYQWCRWSWLRPCG